MTDPRITAAIAAYDDALAALAGTEWRQGRSNPCNLYAVTDPDWKKHVPVGSIATPELAEEAVRSHNERLAAEKAAADAARRGNSMTSYFGGTA